MSLAEWNPLDSINAFYSNIWENTLPKHAACLWETSSFPLGHINGLKEMARCLASAVQRLKSYFEIRYKSSSMERRPTAYFPDSLGSLSRSAGVSFYPRCFPGPVF